MNFIISSNHRFRTIYWQINYQFYFILTLFAAIFVNSNFQAIAKRQNFQNNFWFFTSNAHRSLDSSKIHASTCLRWTPMTYVESASNDKHRMLTSIFFFPRMNSEWYAVCASSNRYKNNNAFDSNMRCKWAMFEINNNSNLFFFLKFTCFNNFSLNFRRKHTGNRSVYGRWPMYRNGIRDIATIIPCILSYLYR